MTFKNIVLNLLRGQIQQSSFLLKKRHRNRFVQTTFLSFSMFSLFKLSKIDFLWIILSQWKIAIWCKWKFSNFKKFFFFSVVDY